MPNNSFDNILSKEACAALCFVENYNETIHNINIVKEGHSLETLLERYNNVFEEDGLLKNYI